MGAYRHTYRIALIKGALLFFADDIAPNCHCPMGTSFTAIWR